MLSMRCTALLFHQKLTKGEYIQKQLLHISCENVQESSDSENVMYSLLKETEAAPKIQSLLSSTTLP
jgi:hypothetical protein